MKLWKTCLLAVAVTAFAAAFNGCIIPCLQPLFAEKEQIFDQTLLGAWTKDDTTFEFSRQAPDKTGYSILVMDKKGRKSVLGAQLGKIGDRQYLCAALDYESMPGECVWFACPAHFLIFRVEQIRPQLKLTMLDFEACKALLAATPAAVPHVDLKPTDAKEKDAIPFLTASTAELQAFIRQHADSAKLFPEKGLMTFEPVAEAKTPAPAPATPAPAPVKQGG
jgi:hypothetical protein